VIIIIKSHMNLGLKKAHFGRIP